MKRGTDYAELAAFVTVAQELSFRRAAVRLGLSPSALSHTIRALEERIGARLLNRTTRSVAPTDAGRDLLARLAPAFADIQGAVDAARSQHDQPAGSVRLNLPKVASRLLLTPAFGEFSRAYPGIRVDLTIEDDLGDIVAGGFDAGIRPGEHVQKDMVAVRVTPPLATAIVAAPAYLATRAAPRHPDDLARHACINYRFSRSGAVYRWSLGKGRRLLEANVSGPLSTNDADVLVDAALAGVGLCYTLETQVAAHLAAGRLVRVLDDWCQPFAGFFLYYPSRRQMPVPLRTLVDFLRLPS